jgi:hypothetical protein
VVKIHPIDFIQPDNTLNQHVAVREDYSKTILNVHHFVHVRYKHNSLYSHTEMKFYENNICGLQT